MSRESDVIDANMAAQQVKGHPTSVNDLPSLDSMSDSEKLSEILTHMRNVAATLEDFQRMGPAGLMKMMVGRK